MASISLRAITLVAAIAGLAVPALAQNTGGGTTTQPLVFGGVQLSTEGVLTSRTQAPAKRSGKDAEKSTAYVSLPRLLERLREHAAGGKKELPADLRYLGGLTQVRQVFVYPAEHDLVLAGPAEPLETGNRLLAVGKVTGRPALQLDDLIVALRAVQARTAGGIYGCTIDLPPGALQKVTNVVRRMGRASDAAIAAEIKKTIGPQQVRVVGVPDTSRLGMAMLVADFRLKRMAMGGDAVPVPGVGTGLGSGAASNRTWFSPAYEPLLVSADGNSYELRGPRLRLDAGAQMFEPHGASEAAKRFAKNFSEKMDAIAAKVEAIADLQNVSDLLVVAALIQQDRLDHKAGVDLSWVYDARVYTPAAYPVAKFADTQVLVTSDSYVAGGVYVTPGAVLKNRETPRDEALTKARKRPGDGWVETVQ